MYRVIVRSKRDADAVRSMLDGFYPGWDFEVVTLRGARSVEEALSELGTAVHPRRLNVLLLGREDSRLAEGLEGLLPPNAVVRLVPRARVRNARLELLARELEVARCAFRLGVRWSPEELGYVLTPGKGLGEQLEDFNIEPAFDVFILYFGGLRLLRDLLDLELPDEYLLILRMHDGEHRVYRGRRALAYLVIPETGLEIEARLLSAPEKSIELRLSKLIELNRDVLGVYAEVSRRALAEQAEDADVVVVPWSGGKDSTATLLLALDTVPREKLRVVYVDTGLEFPETASYVDEVSGMLGVEVIRVYAGVDRALAERGELPTHENRWCTGLKIAAIGSFVSGLAKEGRVLVVVGDRDSESERRAQRPPVRRANGAVRYVAPIKFWGTAHVQLFLISRGLPLNRLYDYGFYRIGCYICPSLRSWELRVITRNEGLMRELERAPFFRSFLARRLQDS